MLVGPSCPDVGVIPGFSKNAKCAMLVFFQVRGRIRFIEQRV
ncbi:hypothetical protein DSUL_20070 [Desulfovibrionales bacterium]